MTFRIEFYDKDLNNIGVLRDFDVEFLNENLNGLGEMFISIPTYKCNALGEFRVNDILCNDKLKSPFQVNCKVFFEQCNTEMFHGWIFNIEGGQIFTRIQLLNVRFYLQKKVNPADRTLTGTPESVCSQMMSIIEGITTTNFVQFSDNETSNSSHTIQIKKGESLAQVLDQFIDLGYEYYFRDGTVVIGKDIGNTIKKPLVYNCRDISGTTIDYNANFSISGARAFNDVMTGSSNLKSSNVPSGFDYITSFSDLDSQEAADSFVQERSNGYAEYDVRLLPEKWCIGEIRAGDYVNVSIKIDKYDCGLFNRRELIRVSSVRTEFINNSYNIILSLSNNPLELEAQGSLAKRVKNLEDNIF